MIFAILRKSCKSALINENIGVVPFGSNALNPSRHKA